MTYKPDMMIYHANCADGFGAAWAVWMKWGEAVEYVPLSHGQPAPEVLGKHVLIGDFSFKRDVMERIASDATSIVVLDHHETAEAELAPWRCSGDFDVDAMEHWFAQYPKPVALFDRNRSGAVMTWQFCHPGKEVPSLLRLIEDRDLWRFTDPMTEPFGVWLRCEPFDFERWRIIDVNMKRASGAEEIASQAIAMLRFFNQKVAEIGRLSRIGDVGGYDVPICNCPPMFASEVGHWLLEQNPDAPFVACYSDQGKSRGWSLRSQDHRLSVSEVARKFGGGGHRNAAGFGVPLP